MIRCNPAQTFAHRALIMAPITDVLTDKLLSLPQSLCNSATKS